MAARPSSQAPALRLGAAEYRPGRHLVQLRALGAWLISRTHANDLWLEHLERMPPPAPAVFSPSRLVELATTPDVIRRVMTRTGLAPMPPPPPLPRVRGQLALGLWASARVASLVRLPSIGASSGGWPWGARALVDCVRALPCHDSSGHREVRGGSLLALDARRMDDR